MKIKNILQLFVITVPFTAIVVVGFYFLLLPQPKGYKPVGDALFGWKLPQTGSVDNSYAYSDIRDPGGIPRGLPVRLKIPIIGVDTAIEDARITSDGRMDVPAGSVNVAWFALGPHPGQVGSAVIGGHFGIDNGIPKVFFNLNQLKKGDKIYVVDDKDDTLAFVVRSTQSFDRNADSTTVFTSNDGLAHLNVITCEGVWNRVNDSYPNRLVVFTDAIPSEDALTQVKTPVITQSGEIPMPDTPSSSVPQRRESMSIRNLYDNPFDSTITSLLIISILFITFKIIHR